MKPAALLKFAIPLVLFSLLAVLAGMWLISSQKKNRKFEKKGVIYYALVAFLIFALLGLIGAFTNKDILDVFLLAQGLVLLLGIIHTWLTFSNFSWTNSESWFPETLFTVFVGLTACVGFLTGFKMANRFLGTGQADVLSFLRVMLVFPLPYLLLRTYHFILQIPTKLYTAWQYPEYTAPDINLDDRNVIFVYVQLSSGCEASNNYEIIQRTRYPLNTTFSDFFQNFVEDYNKELPKNPITCLRKNEFEQDLGWRFMARKGQRGRKRMIDPWLVGLGPIEEGDYILAERLLLDKEASREVILPPPSRPIADDDDILFIER